MINRALIRLKVLQIIYAYYQNGGKNVEATEKELFYSLSKAYDLYNYLLLLMVEVTRFADRRIDNRRNKLRPTYEDLNPNTRFIDNAFIAQLAANQQLEDTNQKLEASNKERDAALEELDRLRTQLSARE